MRQILLILALAVSLAACGRPPSTPSPPPPPVPTTNQAKSTVAPLHDATGNSTSVSSAPSAPPTPQPPAPSSTTRTAEGDSLRDLAARLVASDGQGGLRISESAATELEKLGPQAAERLIPLLQDENVDVRRGAAFYLLGAFNPSSTAHVAAFFSLLDDVDSTVRGFGLSALKQMHRDAQVAAVPQLSLTLDPQRENKAENRAGAARALGSLRTDAAAALPALLAAAESDPDPKVRSATLVAVAQVAAPREAAAALAKGLRDNDAGVRYVAAARLRSLGAPAAPAVSDLAAALADADSRVRDAAAEALILVGPPAVPPLAQQLESPNLESRKYALACLAKIGPAAQSAVPAIQKCKLDPDESVQKLADAALKQIVPR